VLLKEGTLHQEVSSGFWGSETQGAGPVLEPDSFVFQNAAIQGGAFGTQLKDQPAHIAIGKTEVGL